MLLNFTIREYENADCSSVSQLFYDTVHAVNGGDYTKSQLAAWAPSADSLKSRADALIEQYTLVAELNDEVVGFASIDKFGVLDLLFVSKEFQRRGIATALCDALEKDFCEISTYASITAKPFFEKRGYVVVKDRQVKRHGVVLKNFEMRKTNKDC
ncbi:MAG: GNAT family N-acetyltransferase [Corallococcus sp.]|nr:GNAT family N-acetyltransferase [Corallococcus sp.]MCM1359195.1 GNAT family N-acetyltransferase [Corallococcus sp.]MCM1394585.1 GNAT family N-acetyltransferase [Corallococcus sp.]